MVGTTVRKKTLGRPRNKLENNIKMDTKDSMDWINMVQDRDTCLTVVKAVMNRRVL